MGLLDDFRASKADIANTESALAEAERGGSGSAIDPLVQTVMSIGIDGKGPLRSASKVAQKALKDEGGDAERAVKAVGVSAMRWGAAGGFVTGLGGFVTMPVALPANVLEFYVQATRMVAAIAILRGYAVDKPEIRAAVMLTLVGSDADAVLKKAGLATGGGRVAAYALRKLPASALMLVNKAIAFRLLRGVGERFLTRLGRGLPFVGGIVGGGLDAWMMTRIASNARDQFPARITSDRLES